MNAYDPWDRSVLEDPYPAYAWLRANHPTYHVVDHDIWVISRYEESDYQTVAITRLQEILDAIGIKTLVTLLSA